MTCNVSQDATPEVVMAALKREGLGELAVPRPHDHYDNAGHPVPITDWTPGQPEKHIHAARPHAFLLRNYETFSRLQGTNMFKVWQGMRATSAAPSYWAPCSDDRGRVFVDGGVGNNNPTLLAYLEAKSLWPSNGINAPPSSSTSPSTPSTPFVPGANPIGLVLSLGTGLADQKTLSQHWWSRAGSWITSALTTGEMVHDMSVALFTGPLMPAYFRFQPRQNSGALELDECDMGKLQNILKITQTYLDTEPYRTRFNLVCDMLANDEHSVDGSVMTAALAEDLEKEAARNMVATGQGGQRDKATASLMHVLK